MNGRSPQNTHRSDRGNLYKPRFPAGGAIEAIPEEVPPIEAREKPSFRPEVKEGVEAEPSPPVLEKPPIEPEVPAPKARPEEVEKQPKVEATPTEIGKSAVESAEKGKFARAVDELEQAQKGGSNETEQ
ncbi:hypothetical protein E3J85_00820 [Patescibacteria group bacterium]|nr:MAG: hypothetical protein E3J85_00820 [Patescibacteria group bacterium]